MATRAPEAPSTQRAALAAVTARMLAQLRHLWPSLPKGVELQPALRYDVLPAIAREYGDAASTLAADWYDAQRAQLNVPGSFSAEIAPEPPEDMLRALSNWAAEPLNTALTPEHGVEDAQQRTEAMSQKMVADLSRQTVALSAERDPNARGWARFTEDDACGFCRMLADRGGVYTHASIKFGSHDHCHCLAGPVWEENYREWVGTYKRSTNVTDAQRRGAKRWIAENYGQGTGKHTGGKGATVKPQTPSDSGLKGMTDERLQHLIGVTQGLKDTPYKRDQLTRLRAEKKRRGI